MMLDIRLQKYLADAGIASRRKCEELISSGKVKVNDEVITELGKKVDPHKDIVTFEGKKVSTTEKYVYIMLHKPEEYVTTVQDQFNRPTVMDLLTSVKERIYPIGRLDYDTSGLLLVSNDGDLAFRLTHPSHNIDKTYIAKVKGTPNEEELEAFRRGLSIEEYVTAPAEIEIIKQEGTQSSLKIIIHEGKNRQVRKMCSAIGHPVVSLKRVSTGNLFLKDLPKGDFRHLTASEIKYLKSL